MIVVSTLTLGVFCVLSVVQIAAISSREQIVMKYSTLVQLKMILAGAAGEPEQIICVDTFTIQKIYVKKKHSFSPPLRYRAPHDE